jgi:hypothetical protein
MGRMCERLGPRPPGFCKEVNTPTVNSGRDPSPVFA